MSTETLLYFITAFVYAGLAYLAHASDRAVQSADSPAAQATGGNPPWPNIGIPIALALHGVLLYRGIFTEAGINLGVALAVSLIVWLSLLLYWLASFRLQVGGLSHFILPIAAVAVLLPLILPQAHLLPYGNMLSFRVHLLLSMLAYSLLTIAALHALLMAALDKSLHGAASAPVWLRRLPPLVPMETLLFRILGFGFLLLTLSLASGIIFSEAWFNKPFKFTHKVIFGILSWLVFAALLLGRWRNGWRGRKAVRWTLVGFALLLLAYVGSKFVMEVVLQRA